MHAFILAGGFATRLWPLTEKRAKPLLPLAGIPILSRIVTMLPADMPVTVSTNAAFESAIKQWAKETGRTNIEVVAEKTRSDDEKLGALGAIAQWLETTRKTSQDLLLLTGDNEFGFKMEDFLKAYDGITALVAAYDIADKAQASRFGTIVLQPDGWRVAAFEEKPEEPKSTLVSTGCSVIPKRMLEVVREHARKKPDNVGGLFEELLKRGLPVAAFTFKEHWFDIGSFDAYLEATRTLVGNAILQGENTTIEGSRCEGAVVVGAESIIRNCRLKDVVIFEGCLLEDCVLENCVIDDGCVLRHADLQRKMLRAGTVMEGVPTGIPAASFA